LLTDKGKKYLQVYKMEECVDLGMFGTALFWFWGANDWRMTFSLHDRKPDKAYIEGGPFKTTMHHDGSQTITNGEISYFVPAGQPAPKLQYKEIVAPLQSFRSLEANIRLLTEFVNNYYKHN